MKCICYQKSLECGWTRSSGSQAPPTSSVWCAHSRGLAFTSTSCRSKFEDWTVTQNFEHSLKNAIICWNYLYLSQKIAQAESKEAKDRIKTSITTHSVVSWWHINLLSDSPYQDQRAHTCL